MKKKCIGDMEAGSWFIGYGGATLIKLKEPVRVGRLEMEVVAVDLFTGEPDLGIIDHPAVKFEVIEKPKSVTQTEGVIRFDTLEAREPAWKALRRAFPHVYTRRSHEGDIYFLRYCTTADVKPHIQARFGGD